MSVCVCVCVRVRDRTKNSSSSSNVFRVACYNETQGSRKAALNQPRRPSKSHISVLPCCIWVEPPVSEENARGGSFPIGMGNRPGRYVSTLPRGKRRLRRAKKRKERIAMNDQNDAFFFWQRRRANGKKTKRNEVKKKKEN